jgi:hypothetical protein
MKIAVTTTIRTRSGEANVWWPAITEEPSIAAIYDIIVRDRAILVDKLETTIDNGRRIITGRVPTVIGINGVVMIQPLHLIVHEKDE